MPQFVFFCDFNAMFDVGNQNKARHRGFEFIVFVFTVALIFYKIKRFFEFANVMPRPWNRRLQNDDTIPGLQS
jgi:hypothetical protein